MKKTISNEVYIMMQTKLVAQLHTSEYLDTDDGEESVELAKELADMILEVNDTEVFSPNRN